MNALKDIKRRRMNERELYDYEEIYEEIHKRAVNERYKEIVAFLKKYKVVPEDYFPPELILKGKKEIEEEVYKEIGKVLLIPTGLEGLAILCKIIDDFIYPKVIFKFSNVYAYPTPFTQASYLFGIVGLLSLPPVAVYAFMGLRQRWSGKYDKKERKIEVKKEAKEGIDFLLAHELCHDLIGQSEMKAAACETIIVWLEYLSKASNEEKLKEKVIETWCHLRGDYFHKSVSRPMYKIFGSILSILPLSYEFSFDLGKLYGYLFLLEKLKSNSLKPEDLGMMIENIKNQKGIEIYKQVKKLEKILEN
jgi:hypothetical protein